MIRDIAIQTIVSGGIGGLHFNLIARPDSVLDVDRSKTVNVILNSGHYVAVVSGSAPAGGFIQANLSVDGKPLINSPQYTGFSFIDILSFSVP